MNPKACNWSPEQWRFIMTGKWYLLARLLAQAVLGVVFVARIWHGAPIVTPISITGAFLFACGFGVRRWSMRVLGERFRGFEVRREPQGLESRGPYAVLRHPGYLGLALMDVALPLVFGLPWGLVLSSVLIALIVRRIKLEEVLLVKTYIDYPNFAQTRKRLIPGVW